MAKTLIMCKIAQKQSWSFGQSYKVVTRCAEFRHLAQHLKKHIEKLAKVYYDKYG